MILLTTSRKAEANEKLFISQLFKVIPGALAVPRGTKDIWRLVSVCSKKGFTRLCVCSRDSQGLKLVFIDVSNPEVPEYLSPNLIVSGWEFFRQIEKGYAGVEWSGKDSGVCSRLFGVPGFLGMDIAGKSSNGAIEFHDDQEILFRMGVSYLNRNYKKDP